MANIGEERKVYEIPEPQTVPDTVPESVPVEEPAEAPA